MARPSHRHIDSEELDALASSVPENRETGRLSPDELREAQLHVRSCADCREKIERYRRLLHKSSKVEQESLAPGPDCPAPDDVSWDEVAAGLWPELKARQLIMHAATCDHCGPKLRNAVRQRVSRTKEALIRSKLRPCTESKSAHARSLPSSARWLPAVLALLLIAAGWSASSLLSSRRLSGSQIAELAVRTHLQHAQGNFALNLRTDSQQTLNAWLQSNTRLVVPMPLSTVAFEKKPAYRLEGARILTVGSHAAAYISYVATASSNTSAAVGLIVAPDSAAVAGGGFEVDFPRVHFHYSTVHGFKVVTWSVHGMTYALVSEEPLHAQRSCLVCHSSSQDPALHRAPIFSGLEKTSAPVWQ